MVERFNTIDELDSRIEKVVRDNVKHYYTDWKHLDRPKYMGFKGSSRPEDKELILIVRECGTSLFTRDAAEKDGSEANSVLTYYREQDYIGTSFYDISLKDLTLEKTDRRFYRKTGDGMFDFYVNIETGEKKKVLEPGDAEVKETIDGYEVISRKKGAA